jgi:kinesin family protein 11
VRCRPRNSKELNENSPVSVDINEETHVVETKVKTGGKLDTKTYNFDKVFGPETTQAQVYQSVAEPLLEEVLAGYNCKRVAAVRLRP